MYMLTPKVLVTFMYTLYVPLWDLNERSDPDAIAMTSVPHCQGRK
jgi:hypothetical protein